ncbi:MAG: hypothetical protein V4580_17375 [Bacteroidota bacterium]
MKGNKNTQRLEELKKQEKTFFDTYKQKRTDEDKATHLEQMAKCIREQAELKKAC